MTKALSDRRALFALFVGCFGAVMSGCQRRGQSPTKTASAPSPVSPAANGGSSSPAAGWPKLAQLTGDEAQLTRVPRVRGVQVFDHGQRHLGAGGDRWRVSAEIDDPAALGELRALGIEVSLVKGGFPTERELEHDLPRPMGGQRPSTGGFGGSP